MSYLDDPRVLFAAERTLLAWTRTASGLMAMGFLIDRGAYMVDESGPGRALALWIGIGFVLLGVVLCLVSVAHYRRGVAGLGPKEIPQRYWVNFASVTTAGVGVLGLLLAGYLVMASLSG
jgi:putative membrane protein